MRYVRMAKAGMKGGAATPKVISLAAVLLLGTTGCVIQERAGASPTSSRPVYTDESIAKFKDHFYEATDWPMLDDPSSLINLGVDICDGIFEVGAEDLKLVIYKTRESETDWELTNDVAISATQTMCPQYKGQWESAYPTTTP